MFQCSATTPQTCFSKPAFRKTTQQMTPQPRSRWSPTVTRHGHSIGPFHSMERQGRAIHLSKSQSHHHTRSPVRRRDAAEAAAVESSPIAGLVVTRRMSPRTRSGTPWRTECLTPRTETRCTTSGTDYDTHRYKPPNAYTITSAGYKPTQLSFFVIGNRHVPTHRHERPVNILSLHSFLFCKRERRVQ